MIQQQTYLKVADNTGAKELMCIRVLGGTGRRYAQHRRRDRLLQSRRLLPAVSVKKGDVVKAVVVRSVKGIKRNDGSYIKFDENAAVIIKEDKNPTEAPVYSGRLQESSARKDYMKILSLAPEVL